MGKLKKRGGRKLYWEQVREIAADLNITVKEARGEWRALYKSSGKKRKKRKKRKISKKQILALKNGVVGACSDCPEHYPESEHIPVLAALYGEDILLVCTCLDDPLNPTVVRTPLGLRCPLCRDDLYEDDTLHQCEGCSTKFHQECREEFRGRCSTLGCAGRRTTRTEVTVTPRAQITVTLPEPRRTQFLVGFGLPLALLCILLLAIAMVAWAGVYAL